MRHWPSESGSGKQATSRKLGCWMDRSQSYRRVGRLRQVDLQEVREIDIVSFILDANIVVPQVALT